MPMRSTSQTLQNHTTMDRDRRWRSSMVEQLICNQQVAGSSPIASSVVKLSGFPKTIGRVPERSKGTDCKSVATGFEGSNPSPSTTRVNEVQLRWAEIVAGGSEGKGGGPHPCPYDDDNVHELAGVAQLVELQPSKLDVAGSRPVSRSLHPAHLAQLAEHVLGKDEVTRSIRVVGSRPGTVS
jgi:hypothetical protein